MDKASSVSSPKHRTIMFFNEENQRFEAIDNQHASNCRVTCCEKKKLDSNHDP